MDASNLELLYKGLISLGVGVAIYLLKDFKSDFRKFGEGLAALALSLQTLLTKDAHKDETIIEMKEHIAANTKAIGQLKIRAALLEQSNKKSENT